MVGLPFTGFSEYAGLLFHSVYRPAVIICIGITRAEDIARIEKSLSAQGLRN